MNPRFPVYIISKGRWGSRLTSKALERMSVPYHIVVEPQEYGKYAEAIGPAKILVLPFGNLGQGSTPARNWVWEHSISRGAERHWILDDNIRHFFRVNRNKKTKVLTGVCFRACEDFADRYENVALAGLQYEMFIPALRRLRPFILNTRVYSCILIRNDLPFRWRGKYNEDTDLSLRVLKAGWCTILLRSFVCQKIGTMTMKGGNTDELYRRGGGFDGRLEMARSLRRQHPDVARIARRWGRWQHVVDYRPFKRNRLIRKEGIEIPEGVDEYGMRLVSRNNLPRDQVVLPDSERPDAEGAELAGGGGVISSVPPDLGAPVSEVGLRHPEVQRTEVPEAPVDKDREVGGGNEEIGASRELGVADIGDSEAVQPRGENNFDGRIPASDSRHYPAADLRGDCVHSPDYTPNRDGCKQA